MQVSGAGAVVASGGGVSMAGFCAALLNLSDAEEVKAHSAVSDRIILNIFLCAFIHATK